MNEVGIGSFTLFLTFIFKIDRYQIHLQESATLSNFHTINIDDSRVGYRKSSIVANLHDSSSL